MPHKLIDKVRKLFHKSPVSHLRPQMEVKTLSVIVLSNKAFIPTTGKYPSGIHTNLEPIYIVPVTLGEIVPVVQKLLASPLVQLSVPSDEELKIQRGLLPKITGTRSWKQLCRKAIAYTIELSEKGIGLEMSRVDSKGRWEFDPNKRRRFALNTELSEVVQVILDDLETRTKFDKFKKLVTIIEGDTASVLRDTYVNRFVDQSLFKEGISKPQIIRGAPYYGGYMWDYLIPSREVISKDNVLNNQDLLGKQVYVLWDLHYHGVFAEEWFPKHSVLQLKFDDLQAGLQFLPEDLYICDTEFKRSVILTHEYFDDGRDFCLSVE